MGPQNDQYAYLGQESRGLIIFQIKLQYQNWSASFCRRLKWQDIPRDLSRKSSRSCAISIKVSEYNLKKIFEGQLLTAGSLFRCSPLTQLNAHEWEGMILGLLVSLAWSLVHLLSSTPPTEWWMQPNDKIFRSFGSCVSCVELVPLIKAWRWRTFERLQ